MNILHLVSGYSAFACLNESLKENKNAELIDIQEYFTIGPLFNIEKKDGREKRVDYFTKLFKAIHAENMIDELQKNISTIALEKLSNSTEPIVFWYSNDTNEQILLRAMCKHIEYERISLINVSDVVIDDYEIIAVAQCSPQQLRQALQESRKITQKEHEQYAKEWDELMKSTSSLHVYDGNKIVGKPDNYYDKHILAECTNEFLPASKIVGNSMGKIEENIGDSFLDYRLRELIKQGKIILNGELAPLRDMQIKHA